jgi:hypothetical protein
VRPRQLTSRQDVSHALLRGHGQLTAGRRLQLALGHLSNRCSVDLCERVKARERWLRERAYQAGHPVVPQSALLALTLILVGPRASVIVWPSSAHDAM